MWGGVWGGLVGSKWWAFGVALGVCLWGVGVVWWMVGCVNTSLNNDNKRECRGGGGY